RLLRRLDPHVRLRTERALDGVALEPSDQRRDEHDHGDADRDADENQRALDPALAQQAQRDGPFDPHAAAAHSAVCNGSSPAEPGAAAIGSGCSMIRTRSPSATPAPATSTRSPAEMPAI